MSSYFGASFYDRLFELFLSLKSELLPWVGVIIMVRVLINLAMFKSVADMGEIIKDVFFGMLLLCFFVEIVKFSQMIPNLLHENLSSPGQMEIKFPDEGWWSPRYSLWTLSSYITVGSYWIAKLVYTLFVGILIATGAFVIIAGTMLAQRYLLNLFFICLFGASLMPLFWYAINEGMKSLAQSNDQPISNFAILVVGELFKIGMPIVGAFKFFKNPFTDTVKNGVGKGASTVKGVTSAAVNSAATIGRQKPKVAQMYRMLRGQDKITNLNKFPNLQKHYAHQQNKAAFNNWLHDKTPPENEPKNAANKTQVRANTQSKTTAKSTNKADLKQSVQNKSSVKAIENKSPNEKGNGQGQKTVTGENSKSLSSATNKENQNPNKINEQTKSISKNEKVPSDRGNAQKSKDIQSHRRTATVDPNKLNPNKEVIAKRDPEAPLINVENKAPEPVKQDSRNEVNL